MNESPEIIVKSFGLTVEEIDQFANDIKLSNKERAAIRHLRNAAAANETALADEPAAGTMAARTYLLGTAEEGLTSFAPNLKKRRLKRGYGYIGEGMVRKGVPLRVGVSALVTKAFGPKRKKVSSSKKLQAGRLRGRAAKATSR